MRIIWVSTLGDDTIGDGSYDLSYKTLDKALTEFVSGDQIRLMDGTYVTTDSVMLIGVEGSIFSENPLGAYIQPQQTTLHQACVAIIDSPRFTVQGVNIIQAVDNSGNNIGLYVENSSNFIAYTCSINSFDIPSGNGCGIFASGSGRIEGCFVDDVVCGGPELYGIRTAGIDVIDCTVSSLSGDPAITAVTGIDERGNIAGVESPLFLGASINLFYPTTQRLHTVASLSDYTINDIFVTSENDIIAVGYKTTAGVDTIASLRWDGSSWAEVTIPALLAAETNYKLVSITKHTNSEIYATADYGGATLRWDSGSWTALFEEASAWEVFSSQALSDTFVLAGATIAIMFGVLTYFGTVVVWDGAVVDYLGGGVGWSVLGFDFHGVYARGELDVWMVCADRSTNNGRVYFYDALGVTQDATGVLAAGVSRLYDIIGFGATDLWACGADGTVIRHDGLAWNAVYFPDAALTLRKFYGTSATELYVIGDSGTSRMIYKYDGTSWTLVYSGTGDRFRCITGL